MNKFTCSSSSCTICSLQELHKINNTSFTRNKNFNKAGIIIRWKNKNDTYFLVTQSYNNKWGFPKGQQENNETLIECALREVKEETSLDLQYLQEPISQSKRINCRNMKFFTHTMTDIEKIDFDLLKLDLSFDSTGIGWIKLHCDCNYENISLNSVTKYIIKNEFI